MLTCAQLQESVPDTVDHAKGAPEKIGHSVSQVVAMKYFIFLEIFKIR